MTQIAPSCAVGERFFDPLTGAILDSRNASGY
jgi:hypothetical protein